MSHDFESSNSPVCEDEGVELEMLRIVENQAIQVEDVALPIDSPPTPVHGSRCRLVMALASGLSLLLVLPMLISWRGPPGGLLIAFYLSLVLNCITGCFGLITSFGAAERKSIKVFTILQVIMFQANFAILTLLIFDHPYAITKIALSSVVACQLVVAVTSVRLSFLKNLTRRPGCCPL